MWAIKLAFSIPSVLKKFLAFSENRDLAWTTPHSRVEPLNRGRSKIVLGVTSQSVLLRVIRFYDKWNP